MKFSPTITKNDNNDVESNSLINNPLNSSSCSISSPSSSSSSSVFSASSSFDYSSTLQQEHQQQQQQQQQDKLKFNDSDYFHTNGDKLSDSSIDNQRKLGLKRLSKLFLNNNNYKNSEK
jgi:hypothetical protein